MSKKDEKNPYINKSEEDVIKAESGNYYIQIGEELFESDSGKLAFSKAKAEKYFDNVYMGLQDMKKNGTEQEKLEAMECLNNLKIIPLRIH